MIIFNYSNMFWSSDTNVTPSLTQVPVTECSIIPIPVPSQEKLHKQWCLFDQIDHIDFDEEVRKITGDDPAEYEQSQPRDLEILSDLTPSETSNFVQRRGLEPLFDDFSDEFSSYGKRKRQSHGHRRRNAGHQSQSTKITRVQQNISVRHWQWLSPRTWFQ